jgi:hypothetical protein
MEKIHFGLLCLVSDWFRWLTYGFAGDYGVKVAFGTRKPTTQQSFVLEQVPKLILFLNSYLIFDL